MKDTILPIAFEKYVRSTADLMERRKVGDYFTYEESEWEAFCAGAESVQTTTPALDPVEGDVLPPIGSTVYILHGRDNLAHACTVVGYYAWKSLNKESKDHRVFVRVKYEDQDSYNARSIDECYKTKEEALANKL